MAKGGLLRDDVLRRVHEAAIKAGLDRDALLGALDRRFVKTLKEASAPSDQIWADLTELNQLKALRDGTVPLRVWLETAQHLAGVRPEASVFGEALELMGRGTPIAPPEPGPTIDARPSARPTNRPEEQEVPQRPLERPESGGVPAVDVVIVTALKEEYDEARRVDTGALDDWHTQNIGNGLDLVVRTYEASDGKPLRVALSWATRMRTTPTADTAGRLADGLGARSIAMCGVCAGRRGKVYPGDVIVGSLLYTYDTGAVRVEVDPDGTQHRRFQAEPDPFPLNERWLRAAQAFRMPEDAEWRKTRPPTLAAQCDWALWVLKNGKSPLDDPEMDRRCPAWREVLSHLRKLKQVTSQGPLKITKKGHAHINELMLQHRNQLPAAPEWSLHVAPIATGNNVMRDPQLFQKLSDSMRTVLGVEMEVAAIANVAHARQLPWIVMKGVMDHADDEKDDQLKGFAARASAECLIAFLRQHPPGGTRNREASGAVGGTTVVPKGRAVWLAPTEKPEVRPFHVATPAAGDNAPSGQAAPVAVPPGATYAKQLARVEEDILKKLRALPELARKLAEELQLPHGADQAKDVVHALLHVKSGKDAVVALNEVDELFKGDATRSTERSELYDILLKALPFVSDWRGWVESGRQDLLSGKKAFLDLPLSSQTMAEVILAGIDCRDCLYEEDSPLGPTGKAIIQAPAANAVFINRLVEATVGLLAIQLLGLPPDSPRLAQNDPSLQRQVNEKLQFFKEIAGKGGIPRWLLLDDTHFAIEEGPSTEPAPAPSRQGAPVAVAMLSEALPHLRILRLGRGIDGETNMALHIGNLWSKSKK